MDIGLFSCGFETLIYLNMTKQYFTDKLKQGIKDADFEHNKWGYLASITLDYKEMNALLDILQTEQLNKPVVSGKRPTYYSQFNLPPSVVYDLQRIALADDIMAERGGLVYRQIAQNILKAACANGAVDTVAEARAIIKRCKELEDCTCGEECKLTIEDVRKSSGE